VLGLNGMLAGPIVDGSGVAHAMAQMVGGGGFITSVMMMLMILALMLAIAAADATSYFFILAVSNCGYIIFNFLNLNSGWIHRMDAGHVKRPYRAPTFILTLGAIFSYVNAAFMGAGAKVWNPNALWWGLAFAALIFPVFAFRHYVQDRGKFPKRMLEDLGVKDEHGLGERRAGILPYLTLAGGIAVVLITNYVFTL
jgi:amino acid transporter